MACIASRFRLLRALFACATVLAAAPAIGADDTWTLPPAWDPSVERLDLGLPEAAAPEPPAPPQSETATEPAPLEPDIATRGEAASIEASVDERAPLEPRDPAPVDPRPAGAAGTFNQFGSAASDEPSRVDPAPTRAADALGGAAPADADATRQADTAAAAPALHPFTLDTLRDPQRTWREARPRVEKLLRELPQLVRGAAEDLRQGRITPRAEALAGAALSTLLLVLLFAVRATRARGGVVVCIEYPLALRGTFQVQLLKRAKGRSHASEIKTHAHADRARRRTHATRHLVSRETQFRDVRARRYVVRVDGFIQTLESDEIISTHVEQRQIQVRPGGGTRVNFDFNPRSCPLEVRVLWDKRPVPEARVARRGAPGSMRLARGPVQFSLDRGTHMLVVGCSDRVAEVPVEISTFQPMQLAVDLADRHHLLFSGCPPAVEPYLAGDVPAAARALEREAQHETSHLLLARFHGEQGRDETAAAHYESAGRLLEAAELYQSLQQFEKAAALFEQAGEDSRAAEMYRSAGKLLRAGDAYSRADAYDSAVECFKRAGDTGRWIDTLSKKGEHFEAARVALEQGDRVRAIQCLNHVVVGDPHYAEAALRLAEVYEEEGHAELAIHKLEELIASQSADGVPVEAVDRLANMLEESGEYERALNVLERLRRRDASFPNVSTRIEGLRKRRSKENSASVDTIVTNPAADAFSQEFRYEILEELGRGGMGIVFKARDRRLGRVVALKRLPDNLRDHPKAVELFLREARAAAALNHTNIVTLFDAGQEDGTYYITMELLEGLPLQKILQSRERLSTSHVAKLGGQIATGLQYAHEEGIVHRDIKTANLFFTKKKVVKIMDFGLAKMIEEVRRAATVIGGTPYYMAPEQSAGERVDHRADLYALGVTFFEMLTGRVPFREGDVAFHHRHTTPPDPRTYAPDLPDAFAELVLRLMAKSPDERIQTSAEVRLLL
ncbi:MAG TPA: protein kinase, partial [Myxococcota bacterium]